MEFLGCEVIEASDGQAAVEIVRQKCPDLILLDLHMPKMDGLATAEKIREIKGPCERVPIIALTAFNTHGMREAAIAAGCVDYVRKPIDQKQFQRLLKRLFPDSF